jgi:hypothetical protein
MIKFVVDQDVMILEFSSDSWNSRWVWEELKTNGRVTISHVFTLERGDLINEPSKGQDIDEFEYQFHFAKRDGAYHRIKGRVFSIANDVLLADSGIKLEASSSSPSATFRYSNVLPRS